MTWRRTRLASSAIALAGVGIVLAGAARSSPRTDPLLGPNCVHRGVLTVAAPRGADPFEVVGSAATAAEAVAARDAIRSFDMFHYFQLRLGTPFLPGQSAPLEIFLDPSLPDADGITTTFCEPPTETALVILSGLPADERNDTLGHELFHAFQNGVAAKPLAASWWGEATASWATWALSLEDAKAIDGWDEAFSQAPSQPLDLFEPGDAAALRHPYGAFRFVQWLDDKLGTLSTTNWAFLKQTFKDMAAGENPTAAVRRELKAQGKDLGEELGAFWGDKSLDKPRFGPLTRRKPYTVGIGNETVKFPARRLGAAMIKLVVGGLPGQISIEVEPVKAGGYVWVSDGDTVHDWTDGGKAEFCVRGLKAGTRHWPGVFRLAFTNGSEDSLRNVVVKLSGSIEDCGKETGGLPKTLPKHCPPPPPSFPPPAHHSEYYVFGHRFAQVGRDLAGWSYVIGRRYPTKIRTRLFVLSPWLHCTAIRAKKILPAPDAKLQHSTLAYAGFMDEASAAAAKRNLADTQSALEEAGRQAVLIAGRVASQDVGHSK